MKQQDSHHDALPGYFVQYGDLADVRIKFLLEKLESMIQHD